MNDTSAGHESILIGKPHVKRLCERQAGYLQVVLSEMSLFKRGPGLEIVVHVAEDAPSIIDWRGKRDLFTAVTEFGEESRHEFKERLESFLQDPRQLAYRFDCSRCPLRYANGGTLPIVRLNDIEYFCLFYRDIFPIGWNIANGASDTLDELLDPSRILLRECGEELLAFDDTEEVIYAYDPGDENRPPGFQKQALQAWADLLNKPELLRYQTRALPLKWIEGPDRVRAQVLHRTHSSAGYFLSITPEDNAIEVDRFALINLRGNVCLVDGEHSSGRPVSLLVGLFRVDGFEDRLSGREFIPDRHCFMGEQRSSEQWPESMEANIAHLEGNRSDTTFSAFEASEKKLDLCPIARSAIQRYLRWRDEARIRSVSEPPAAETGAEYDIFISYKSEATSVARWMYQYLRNKGFRTFCSGETLAQLGESDYVAAISRALDKTTCLVVLATKPDDFVSGWVEYEWSTFLNEILSGRKPNSELFVFADNVQIAELPYSLRNRHVVPYSPSSPHDSFESLDRHIRSALDRALR